MSKTPSVTPNVARAGGIMMASLFLSRVLGILRDTVMAAKFGIGFETDAYRLAFQIPDLIFFAVAGGALSSAFIPVFSEFLHTDREEEAWNLFSVVVTLMSLIVIGFIALAWIFALPLAHLIAPGKPAEMMPLIAQMSRILLPAQFAFFIGGIMFGTLYTRQKFAAPGLAPNVYNLGIIFGALASPVIIGMAWGAAFGAFVGSFLIPFVILTRMGVRFKPSLDLRTPGVKKVFKLMLPVVLGLSLPGVYGMIMQVFGSFYAVGVNTALDLSNKLMQAPLGIFGQSLALAVFPALSQFFAQDRMDMFRKQLASTLRTTIYITLPISALMIALAPEIVSLAFQYGKTQQEDVVAVAESLRMFSIGIFAWCMHPILMRGFFAMQTSVTPIVLGTATTALFLILVFVLRETPLGYLSLPLASSISAVVLACLLTTAVARKVGEFDIPGIVLTFVKSAAASATMGLTVFGLCQVLPHGKLWDAIKLCGVGLVGGWVYFFATFKMSMPETDYVSRALKRRQTPPIEP